MPSDYIVCPAGVDIYIPQKRDMCEDCQKRKWWKEIGRWEEEKARTRRGLAGIDLDDPATWTTKLSTILHRKEYNEMTGVYELLRNYNPGWIDLDIDVDLEGSDCCRGCESGYEGESESDIEGTLDGIVESHLDV